MARAKAMEWAVADLGKGAAVKKGEGGVYKVRARVRV
jgi:hypothetical protein